MLNSYSSSSTTINNNVHLKPACVGTLQKSHNKSKFKRFHIQSEVARWVFSDYPHVSEEEVSTKPLNGVYEYSYKSANYILYGPEVVILQVMCFGDEELMIEYVLKSDYDMDE